MSRRMIFMGALCALVLVGAGCRPLDWTGEADPPYTCAAWASPTGNDGAAGTEAAPVFSPRFLAQKLEPGETGCFLAGTYDFTGECRGCMNTGGTPGNKITLRPAPGVATASVVLTGQWRVDATTNDIIIRDLTLLGSGVLGSNLLHIIGDRVEIRRNNISNPEGICVFAGNWNAYSHVDNGDTAEDLLLSGNRIHHCGVSEDLWHDEPSTSGFHGIYLSKVDGAIVADNAVYANKWRGIQFWPYARDVLVERNVFDGNATNVNIGSNLAEGYPWASQDVVVRDNIISNATFFRPDKNFAQVFGNFPNDGIDRGNRVEDNCLWLPGAGDHFAGYGYQQSGNIVVDPGFPNAPAGHFALAAGSPCVGKGPRGIQPTGSQPPMTADGQECTIVGTAGDDQLVGTPGDDVICGLGGNDTIHLSGGWDHIDGGPGTDRLSYATATSGIVVNFTNSDAWQDGAGWYQTFLNMEEAVGSPFGDTLVGSPGDDRLFGEAGNDTLYGYEGDDYLDGGPGTDACYPGPGADTVVNCE